MVVYPLAVASSRGAHSLWQQRSGAAHVCRHVTLLRQAVPQAKDALAVVDVQGRLGCWDGRTSAFRSWLFSSFGFPGVIVASLEMRRPRLRCKKFDVLGE